jgi:hypothetical protein
MYILNFNRRRYIATDGTNKKSQNHGNLYWLHNAHGHTYVQIVINYYYGDYNNNLLFIILNLANKCFGKQRITNSPQ